MPHESLRLVAESANSSDLVRAATSVRQDGGVALALGQDRPRRLSREEIAGLESLGNTCVDWTRVRVADGFDWRRVRQCDFHGDVTLGRFTGKRPAVEGLELPAGLVRSALADCVVGHNALIQDVKLLIRCVVGEAAILFDCGSVGGVALSAFGNGRDLALAIETGGREVPVYAEITVPAAAAIAGRRFDPGLLRRHRQAVADYARRASCDRSIIEHHASVRHTPRVNDVYVGPHATVDGATLLADSTLLSNAEEPTRVLSGACVTGSVLQWGSTAQTMAIVDRSVLTEHSLAERHAKITDSLIGPGTGVGEGEVTASLVGPLVGFHHQALLIAALWPEGKGNVSHGANVGSNHTSRSPDQEFWPGEGAFFGLDVSIKYPADYSRAPYTLITTGVTTLPQRLAFPFSLVMPPSTSVADVPTAYNEIVPAWMLSDNLYAVRRTEKKHRDRDPTRRTVRSGELFRPELIDLMRDALGRLEAVAVKDAYTDRDIDGLGKNFLLEATRRRAITAYRFHVRLYALLGLKDRFRQVLDAGGDPDQILDLDLPDVTTHWQHQRSILRDDFSGGAVAALALLPEMLEQAANDVEASRRKDDERGRRIIEDYEAVHPPAAADPLVRHTWQEARRLQRETEELLDRLGWTGRSRGQVG